MTDYFSFYGLPVSFNPDLPYVKQKFYELSKKYHPDFFINESEEKQVEVLELSTINNKAYQVLTDPQKRLQYVLELKGQLTEGEHYVLPQDFLMEMMDVNESLMDLQFDPDPERLLALEGEVEAIKENINKNLLALTATFKTEEGGDQSAVLAEVKDLYYRAKYLVRIAESLAKAKRG
ncbi:molecular chaperone HscB [Pedobacter sp. UYP24]